ncbi:MAG: hypothetical protein ACTSUP_07950 [Candidatus Heimdallarchaeaceae archaeon]
MSHYIRRDNEFLESQIKQLQAENKQLKVLLQEAINMLTMFQFQLEGQDLKDLKRFEQELKKE